MYSENELVFLLKKKDEKACNYIFEKYAGALHGLICQILPSQHTESALEKTFVSVCENIHLYDASKYRFFTWMLQIARKTALEKLNNNNVRMSFDEINNTKILRKWIRKLAPEDQQFVGLSYFKGLSVADLSLQLNLPKETVKRKIRFALSKLNE